MAQEKGSVVGGTLLIAGSCIGAGMLGLPVISGVAGFFPSLFMFVVAWLFMTTTALLLVEVNGWFNHKVNLITMVGDTLGKGGKALCWFTYLFLFYALLVAYISGIGSLTSTFFKTMLGVNAAPWLGSLFFVILFGWVVYLGTRRVDMCNRGLMIGKIGFFLLLILVGVQYVQPYLLTRTDPKYSILSLPLLVIAFGFHNMIPSLVSYLNGDIKRVRLTIIGGSLFTFAIYLLWEILVLGIVPFGGPNGLAASLKLDREASQAIAMISGSSSIRVFAQGLAFFAILTSFLAQALSLVHFLSDGFKISYKKQENLGLCLVALVPPLILALIYPQLFFKALNFAGGICAMILFGLLPVGMVWIGRQRRGSGTTYQVPGGKATLVAIFAFALVVLFLQLSNMFGASYIPQVS